MSRYGRTEADERIRVNTGWKMIVTFCACPGGTFLKAKNCPCGHSADEHYPYKVDGEHMVLGDCWTEVRLTP